MGSADLRDSLRRDDGDEHTTMQWAEQLEGGGRVETSHAPSSHPQSADSWWKRNKRPVISFTLLAKLILLYISGKMIQDYGRHTPQGQIGLTLHGIAARLFVLAAIVHIVFNRKTFRFKKRTK
jgi:hypothetical protein